MKEKQFEELSSVKLMLTVRSLQVGPSKKPSSFNDPPLQTVDIASAWTIHLWVSMQQKLSKRMQARISLPPKGELALCEMQTGGFQVQWSLETSIGARIIWK
jgi:hypothetical protein